MMSLERYNKRKRSYLNPFTYSNFEMRNSTFLIQFKADQGGKWQREICKIKEIWANNPKVTT